jgi:hypothetical protein
LNHMNTKCFISLSYSLIHAAVNSLPKRLTWPHLPQPTNLEKVTWPWIKKTLTRKDERRAPRIAKAKDWCDCCPAWCYVPDALLGTLNCLPLPSCLGFHAKVLVWVEGLFRDDSIHRAGCQDTVDIN